jgi:succinate dehydrogenase flavin-adding protein (antitoxin of CptAB toxin-antitoxin module)
MKELDVLLGRFVEAEFDTLGEHELDDYERLLESSQESVIDWLLGGVAPEDPAIAALVARILRTG